MKKVESEHPSKKRKLILEKDEKIHEDEIIPKIKCDVSLVKNEKYNVEQKLPLRSGDERPKKKRKKNAEEEDLSRFVCLNVRLEKTEEYSVEIEIPVTPNYFRNFNTNSPYFDECKTNFEYFTQNKDDLIEKYEGMWFAIWKSKVIPGYGIGDLLCRTSHTAIISFGTDQDHVFQKEIPEFVNITPDSNAIGFNNSRRHFSPLCEIMFRCQGGALIRISDH